eukprot:4302811-Pyramimonas_sp.AAC.1
MDKIGVYDDYELMMTSDADYLDSRYDVMAVIAANHKIASFMVKNFALTVDKDCFKMILLELLAMVMPMINPEGVEVPREMLLFDAAAVPDLIGGLADNMEGAKIYSPEQ